MYFACDNQIKDPILSSFLSIFVQIRLEQKPQWYSSVELNPSFYGKQLKFENLCKHGAPQDSSAHHLILLFHGTSFRGAKGAFFPVCSTSKVMKSFHAWDTRPFFTNIWDLTLFIKPEIFLKSAYFEVGVWSFTKIQNILLIQ